VTPGAPAGVAQLTRRLQGVLVARSYVMLAYDVRADLLDQATALTPGIESPTVSPLHREGWVAVQAMVQRAEVHRIMDELYELGARANLVPDISNCRLCAGSTPLSGGGWGGRAGVRFRSWTTR
jgi:ATP phosphoribosyltransferase